jgi:hypothetical protein
MKLGFERYDRTTVCSRVVRRWIRAIASVCVACLVLAFPAAQASLVISNSDIAGGHYIYDLTYEEMVAGPAVFTGDVFFTTNITWFGSIIRTFDSQHEGGVYMYAEIVYRFDFTGTDYVPTNMIVRDDLTLFNNHDPNENSLSTTAWSTNGVDYFTLHQLTSPVPPDVATSLVESASVALPSAPGVVYYRAAFTNFESGFSEDQTQWNRLDFPSDDATRCFRVDFAVVDTCIVGSLTNLIQSMALQPGPARELLPMAALLDRLIAAAGVHPALSRCRVIRAMEQSFESTVLLRNRMGRISGNDAARLIRCARARITGCQTR